MIITIKQLKPVIGFFKSFNVSSKAILLEPGCISRSIWFSEAGILRAYTIEEERKRSRSYEGDNYLLRDVTKWIVSEGGFLTDFSSFWSNAPATCFIETLTPCKLYKLTYENHLIMQRCFPEEVRLITGSILQMTDTRVKIGMLRDPCDRLHMFELMYPEVSRRLSLGVQASYLNIDRATLSRLRGKMR